MILGAQMYTVREFTQTVPDLERTLEKIAKIGYKSVQISGTCVFDPKKIRGLCDGLGLKVAVTHTNPDRILNETDAVIDEHLTLGCKYIGIGSMPGRYDRDLLSGVEKFVRDYSPAAEKMHKAGVQLQYHNHDFEFAKVGDITLLQHMAALMPAELLGFIVDTFWAQAGGANPARLLLSLEGRVPCVHLKDMIYKDGRKMAVIGEGNMDWSGILDACEKAGAEWLLIEQDDCYGEDPFGCLERSFKNLKKMGYS